jgi:hypothetical protein
MFLLPMELQRHIYSFDRTYHDIFYQCLCDISDKLCITYRFSYSRPSIKTPNDAWIERYEFLGIRRRTYTDEQYAFYIDQNHKYKFLVESYYLSNGNDFVFFYEWFNNNLKNIVKQIVRPL